MFNNLVNLHDFAVLFEKLRTRGSTRVLGGLTRSRQERVARSWSHTEDAPRHWWDIPEVERRWNLLITGDRDLDPTTYAASKHLPKRDDLSALSLGCGGGDRELKWLATGRFRHIDAYDLSQERIAYATAQAAEAGVAERVSYRVADVFELQIQPGTYDVALLENALHHFVPVASILRAINGWLRPGGHLVVNEFVGPSRFQWTKRQLEIANDALDRLPAEYRKTPDGRLKTRAYRPGRLSMALNDPSEAAESSLILPTLTQMFEVVEMKEYGGTILPLVFKDIAHNFIAPSEQTARLLKLLFDIEDEALRSKAIASDYVYAICRKRD